MKITSFPLLFFEFSLETIGFFCFFIENHWFSLSFHWKAKVFLSFSVAFHWESLVSLSLCCPFTENHWFSLTFHWKSTIFFNLWLFLLVLSPFLKINIPYEESLTNKQVQDIKKWKKFNNNTLFLLQELFIVHPRCR